jgi:hypothetical protein
MPQPNIIRPTKLTMHIPEDVRARMDLFLWSEVEQRVPKGAYQQFIVRLINRFFEETKNASDQSI